MTGQSHCEQISAGDIQKQRLRIAKTTQMATDGFKSAKEVYQRVNRIRQKLKEQRRQLQLGAEQDKRLSALWRGWERPNPLWWTK